ncbi:sulfide/dihydroorotate dehydrogenase-like FAD/NAD-binding protein [candidate division KSB1 bacterium]
MYKITEARFLAENVKLFKIMAPDIAKARKAGQFVIVRLVVNGERIPLTIADSNIEDGTITLVVQEVGKTTAIMNKLEAGDTIIDVVGPLGTPTHIENFGTAVCVGGGIGVAVVMPIAKALKEAGNTVISIIGAREKDLVILEDDIKAISDEVIVTTDNGSYGFKGFVTQPLQAMLEEGKKVDVAFAIGPMIMMKNVAKVTEPFKISTYVSLNPVMVDGTGMCGGCRVSVGGETKFACVDGPEFDGHDVDFDELLARLGAYRKQEEKSYEHYKKGHCGMEVK